MYGGSAGGGKSEALLMAALQYVDRPGYAALLLRRSYGALALPSALMDRGKEWLSNTDAHWRDQTKTWTFPSGATLTFGYLKNEADKYRYQSAEFQFIGFDELTQFPESQYTYMFSRLRRLAGVNIPIRMRAASNPGNIGHDWVRSRFVDEPREPGRAFIRATARDNPHLDIEDYATRLRERLDPITIAYLLDGDWTAREQGAKFRREWLEIVDAVPVSLSKARYWDLASKEPEQGKDPDFTAGCLMGIDEDGIIYILDMQHRQGTPGTIEKLIKSTAELDGRTVPIYMEQEPGASGVAQIDGYRRHVLQGFTFTEDRPTGSKEVRANPLSSQAEAGNVKMLRGSWNSEFLDEAEGFPSGPHDDMVDAASGAYNMLTVKGRPGVRFLE